MIKQIFLILLFITSNLFAGSADAVISGITSSKRTKIDVRVGDISGIIRRVTLTIDGKSYTFNPSKDEVIHDKKSGVYVLIAEDSERIFRMWMIPGSEKVIHSSSGAYKSKFAAKIEATDPRKNDKYTLTPVITIGCLLDYSI